MRLLTVAALAFAATLATVQPGAARSDYPWCLHDSGGAVNCGFVSEQQCRQSRGANMDMCMINGLYQGGYVPERRAGKRPPPR